MRFLRKMAAMVCAAAMSATLVVNVSADSFLFDMEKAHETHSGGQAYTYLFRNDMERRDKYNLDTAWLIPGCSFELEYEWSGEIGEEWTAPVALRFQSWTDETLGVEKADFNDGRVEVEPSVWTDTTALFTYDDIVAAWGSDNFSQMYSFQVHDTGTSINVSSITLKDIMLPEGEMDTLNGGIAEKNIVPYVEVSETLIETVETSMETNSALSEETIAIISEVSDTEVVTDVSDIRTEAQTEIRNEPIGNSVPNFSLFLPFLIIGLVAVILLVLCLYLMVIRPYRRIKKEEKQTMVRNRHYHR